jgi:hypothetical protein
MAFRFPICPIEDWRETVPSHEDCCGLKTAHLWHRNARRATGSILGIIIGTLAYKFVRVRAVCLGVRKTYPANWYGSKIRVSSGGVARNALG